MGERLEFYLYEDELWCKDDQGHNVLVDKTQTELIDKMLSVIREHYPEAYKALQEEYKKSAPNKRLYHYMIVKRFLKCSFGQLDSTCYDVDRGKMNFERVDCPIRRECKYDGIICSPIYETTLSSQEMAVGKLLYDGFMKEEIAGMLFLSPETVNNHIRHIYKKLGIHEKAEFIKYVKEHNLYDRQRD